MSDYYIFFSIEIVIIVLGMSASIRSHRLFAAGVVITNLVLFSGLRDLVGIDTASYHEVFKNLDPAEFPFDDWLTFEPLFSAYMWIFKTLLNDANFFMLGVSLLQGVVLFFIVRNQPGRFLFLFVYLCGFYIQNQFNIVRAGTAVLLLICAYTQRLEGRSGFIAAFSAVLFHYSALVFLPFVLVGIGRKNIYIFCSVVFFAILVLLMGGDRFADKFEAYFIKSAFYSSGQIELTPFYFMTTFFAVAAHFYAGDRHSKWQGFLFIFLMSLKILQMAYPVLWRLHDMAYFLWFSVLAFSLQGRVASPGGIALIVLSLLNLFFVTFNNIENEESRLADRLNRTGEVSEAAFDAPLLPYRTFLGTK